MCRCLVDLRIQGRKTRTFGALINVPTTAIFSLHVEHSNDILLFVCYFKWSNGCLCTGSVLATQFTHLLQNTAKNNLHPGCLCFFSFPTLLSDLNNKNIIEVFVQMMIYEERSSHY